MRFVEDTRETWTAIQLEAVEKEMEQQKREWEANRLAEFRREEEERKRIEAEDNNLLTFSREDAKNQVNISSTKNNHSLRASGNRRKLLTRDSIGLDKKLGNKGQITTKAINKKSSPNTSIKTDNSNKKVSHKNIVSPKTSPNTNKKNQTISKPNVHSPPKSRLSKAEASASHRRQLFKRKISEKSNIDDNANDSEVPSEKSNKRNEDFDDSECSLDVMIDSNDAPDSDSNQMSTNGNSTPTNNDSDSDDGSSSSNIPARKTRSRGTVKINLWSLATSPIENSGRKSGLRNASIVDGKTKGKAVNSKEKPVLKRPISSVDDATDTGSDTGSLLEHGSHKLKELKVLLDKQEIKQAKILDGLSQNNTKPVRRSGGGSGNKKAKLSTTKNHTLDKWVSKIPKVNVSLEDQESCRKSTGNQNGLEEI